MDKNTKAILISIFTAALLNVAAALAPHVAQRRDADPLKLDQENGVPDVYVSDRKWLLQRFDRLETGISMLTDRLDALEKQKARK